MATAVPHDNEAESAVLAALMVTDNMEDVANIFSLLTPADFFVDWHRWIYEACFDIWREGDGVNEITVASRLHKHETGRAGETRLEAMGGRYKLQELIRQLPTPVGVLYYAKIVKGDGRRRELLHRASRVMDMARKDSRPFEEVYSNALDMFYDIGRESSTADAGGPVGDVMAKGMLGYLVEQIEAPRTVRGITTGLPGLDRRIGGFEAECSYSLSAPSSLGKSFLVSYWALEAARRGQKVVYFSTEMSENQVYPRFQHMLAGIDAMTARRRFPLVHWTEEEKQDLNQAAGELASLPMSLYCQYQPTVAWLRSILRREAARRKPDMIIIDGLHSMDLGADAIGRKDILLGNAARQFNQFSQEWSCPVIYVVHQNRADSGGDMLNKLKDSSEIGNLANTAMFLIPMADDWSKPLSADAARERSSHPGWANCHINVAKARTGMTGNVPARLNWRMGGRWMGVEG